ncbi:MAG: hypothetical protein P9L92_01125 [Candidatus Electryonea clarkiae]|nr:hypothetical protein [Candidatus Electryonea clarkiae]MDP8289170.1 hypothetical protein [Candidatus Electryonea clarkiae]
MGAFFLFKNREDFNENAVKQIFFDKGFNLPREFNLEEMTLWLYRKQLVEEDNFFESETGSTIYSVGTIIYKGKSYRDSLAQFLTDFETCCIDVEQIIGSYCLIIYCGGKLSLFIDPINSYHTFINSSQTIISSSFLALLKAHRRKLKLNRPACLENLTTGFITGPDTIVEGIQLINGQLIKQIKSNLFEFPDFSIDMQLGSLCSNGIESCVRDQVDHLIEYYHQIEPCAKQYGVDLGLSGGYDSTLIFSLCDYLSVKPAIHTHWTDDSHSATKKSAEEIAATRGLDVKCIRTKDPDIMSEEEINSNIKELIYYFDGRNCQGFGFYTEVYTKSYRKRILGDNKLGLNGIAGEIYRNWDRNGYKKVNFADWMFRTLMFNSVKYAFRERKDRISNTNYIKEKTAAILGLNNINTIDNYTIRRYYGEVRSPYSHAVKSNSEHQLSFFLTPFGEYQSIRLAYKALPYLGLTGKFQSAMIKSLDGNVADNITSSYGFPLSKEPLSYRMRGNVRGYLPFKLQIFRDYYHDWHNKDRFDHLNNVLAKSELIREIIELIQELFPEVIWERIFTDKYSIQHVVFTGAVLKHFSDCISY